MKKIYNKFSSIIMICFSAYLAITSLLSILNIKPMLPADLLTFMVLCLSISVMLDTIGFWRANKDYDKLNKVLDEILQEYEELDAQFRRREILLRLKEKRLDEREAELKDEKD